VEWRGLHREFYRPWIDPAQDCDRAARLALPRRVGGACVTQFQEVGEPGQHAQQLIALRSQPPSVFAELLDLSAQHVRQGELGQTPRLPLALRLAPHRKHHAEHHADQPTADDTRR